MAKGKASVSSSGASMSKYDVEVEARLKALEAEAHPKCDHDTAGGDGDLALRVQIIEEVLKRVPEVNFVQLSAQLRRELTQG